MLEQSIDLRVALRGPLFNLTLPLERVQAQIGLGPGRGPDGTDIAAQLDHRAREAAVAEHGEEPRGAQPRVLIQGRGDEGPVGIEQAGTNLRPDPDEAVVLRWPRFPYQRGDRRPQGRAAQSVAGGVEPLGTWRSERSAIIGRVAAVMKVPAARILVIDDDPEVVDILATTLRTG